MTDSNYAQLSPLVHVVLGLNPGNFTLQGTNTYLIGQGRSKIMIDTGQGKPGYLAHLKQSLEKMNCLEISMILITHGHHDHIGGIDQVKQLFNVPVYKQNVENDPQFEHIKNGQVFITDGVSLRAIYTPGHTPDHVSFYLDQEEAIFTGDCVLGQGTAVFDNLSLMLQSLTNLLRRSPKRLYPGHGPLIENGIEVIQQYIQRRKDREEEILTLLQVGPLTSLELVERIYKEIPDDVVRAANQVVQLHLEKLIEEHIVILDSGLYSLYSLNKGI
jgi:glyoxylase-like metal-dependent hydrolase (beta-lactamase superfamily II)